MPWGIWSPRLLRLSGFLFLSVEIPLCEIFLCPAAYDPTNMKNNDFLPFIINQLLCWHLTDIPNQRDALHNLRPQNNTLQTGWWQLCTVLRITIIPSNSAKPILTLMTKESSHVGMTCIFWQFSVAIFLVSSSRNVMNVMLISKRNWLLMDDLMGWYCALTYGTETDRINRQRGVGKNPNEKHMLWLHN